MRRLRWSTVLLPAVLLAACGSGDPEPGGSAEPPRATPSASAESSRPEATVRKAHCAADAGNCAAVTGRVLYVEAVDPDGDGDAHYVVAGGSVTAPGLSVIDVGRDLRPRRLPSRGELVSAAGPVYTGSHGQHQIEAVVVNHQRRH
jgi:hypothetical protein